MRRRLLPLPLIAATSSAVAAMEQALLNQINEASTSTDAALTDFERVVRIVATPFYAPHWALLESANIAVIGSQDNRTPSRPFAGRKGDGDGVGEGGDGAVLGAGECSLE